MQLYGRNLLRYIEGDDAGGGGRYPLPRAHREMVQVLLVSLVAFVAAAVNAVAGGGTFLTFPALTGIAKLPERIANMTSTVGLWPGSASSIVPVTREIRRLPRGMLATFAAVSLVGGGIGSWLLLTTSNETFRYVIPWLLAFATGVFAFSKPIARWAGRGHGDRSFKWTALVAAMQFFVAVYGGYFGAGIGVLMLAGLSFAGLDDIHQMNALKVLLATLINGVAAIVFLFYKIDWAMAGAMAIASTIGGFVGMVAGRRLKPDRLRLFILAIGVGLSAYYFHHAYAPHRRPPSQNGARHTDRDMPAAVRLRLLDDPPRAVSAGRS